MSPNQTIRRHWTFKLFGRRFGFERSFIYANNRLYLERWIIYAGGTLRLHKFHAGDDERALHDHPWWFVTFPLRSYKELIYDEQLHITRTRIVKAFRFHFRKAGFRHRVILPFMAKPFFTIVVTGNREKMWGFYPKPDEFIPYYEWSNYEDVTTDR